RAPGHLVLAAIVVVAFLVRLAAVLAIEVDPRVGWHFDMTWYDGVARRLLKGWGYIGVDGAPTAAWPPGYPLLLAAVYSIFGPSLLAAKVTNALLGGDGARHPSHRVRAPPAHRRARGGSDRRALSRARALLAADPER